MGVRRLKTYFKVFIGWLFFPTLPAVGIIYYFLVNPEKETVAIYGAIAIAFIIVIAYPIHGYVLGRLSVKH